MVAGVLAEWSTSKLLVTLIHGVVMVNGQSSRTFISYVISCPILWKWNFGNLSFRNLKLYPSLFEEKWQFTCAPQGIAASWIIFVIKWNERVLWVWISNAFPILKVKHIWLTYPYQMPKLRSDIRTLLEVATTSGNPEAWSMAMQ